MNSGRHVLQRDKKVFWGAAILTLAGLSLLIGCSTHYTTYGKYQNSPEVGRMFENEAAPPDYQYYYTGTLGEPLALIGLKPPYTLDNHLWEKTDHAQLRRLKENMLTYVMYSPIMGSRILGPKGEEIGIYYSRWKGGHIEVVSSDKVNVHIFDPDDPDRKNNS